jgi:hypothetical protein
VVFKLISGKSPVGLLASGGGWLILDGMLVSAVIVTTAFVGRNTPVWRR